MTEPVITHEFVRTLTRALRSSYGKHIRHTDVLEVIANSLGWKADALMHKLKSQVKHAPVEALTYVVKFIDLTGSLPHTYFADAPSAESVLQPTSRIKTPSPPDLVKAVKSLFRQNPDVIVLNDDPRSIEAGEMAREMGSTILYRKLV